MSTLQRALVAAVLALILLAAIWAWRAARRSDALAGVKLRPRRQDEIA